MLAEAAFVAVSTPGPLRAFYERLRVRRGSQIAIVAVARKLAVLFWHLLTREQDYAFQRPLADAQEAPRPRTARRRPAPPRKPDPGDQERLQPTRPPRTRARALRTSRNRLPPTRRRLEGNRTDKEPRHDLTFIRPEALAPHHGPNARLSPAGRPAQTFRSKRPATGPLTPRRRSRLFRNSLPE